MQPIMLDDEWVSSLLRRAHLIGLVFHAIRSTTRNDMTSCENDLLSARVLHIYVHCRRNVCDHRSTKSIYIWDYLSQFFPVSQCYYDPARM